MSVYGCIRMYIREREGEKEERMKEERDRGGRTYTDALGDHRVTGSYKLPNVGAGN